MSMVFLIIFVHVYWYSRFLKDHYGTNFTIWYYVVTLESLIGSRRNISSHVHSHMLVYIICVVWNGVTYLNVPRNLSLIIVFVRYDCRVLSIFVMIIRQRNTSFTAYYQTYVN